MKAKTHKIRTIAPDKRDDYEFKPSLTMWQRALQRIRRDRPTMTAIVTLLILAVLSILASVISDALQIDPNTQDLRNNYAALFAQGHPLGTDELGRDHLSRLLYGGQVSLGIAFAAAFLSLGIGVAVGAFAGFYGGVVDDFIIWFVTTLTSIPGLFLLILISALLKPSPATLVVILGILGWTGTTRLVRSEAYAIREQEFVVAARALGASNLRIMFLHIVPNMFSLLVVDLVLFARQFDPDGIGVELSWFRHPRAHPNLGQHAERRPGLCQTRAPPGVSARPVDHTDRVLLLFAWRWPAGCL